MPKPTLHTVRQSLLLARSLISGAAIGLNHVVDTNKDDRPGDPITPEIAMEISLDQQAAFIVGELERAVESIRRAQTDVAAIRAIARRETADVGPVADVARAA